MNGSEFLIVARRVSLSGQVQGIGLRPAIARVANELGLAGFVRNAARGVEIHVEATERAVTEFQHRLPRLLPEATLIETVPIETRQTTEPGRFLILESEIDGPLTARVPLDRASCAACLAEVATPGDRRFGYPLGSCTDCGPRYSLLHDMPWDRCRSSMSPFRMCADCEREYANSANRRCHSQTNCCAACGPRVWLSGGTHGERSVADSPLDDAAAAVRAGKVLALRGLGGYQLVADATNQAAVERLRQRKRRRTKPLAVMVPSVDEAARFGELSERERELLTGVERPIVLVQARTPSSLCESVHRELREVGLFLPTTPLHWLLLDRVQRPLVVTSGNVDGEPLAADVSTAERELRDVADLWLHHDRDIVRAIDDSVLRVIANRPVTMRSARGLSPLPLPAIERLARQLFGTASDIPHVLAVGGHQKNAVAVCNSQQIVLGPHIGDLESLAARERFTEHVRELQEIYRCRPRVIVHDQHPDYFTTRWAEECSRSCQREAVQHHHAHVVAAMAENDWLDREVLGVAFDGTGHGPDGTIWGGEFLRATVTNFQRVAHLRPFRLLGGDTAIREPWRVAALLLMDAVGSASTERVLGQFDITESLRRMAVPVATNSQVSPITSSAGRLFDGVAAIILGLTKSDYEGHAAMCLESAAEATTREAFDFSLTDSSPVQLDWRPMIAALIDDRQRGCPASLMAAKFHRGLARAIAAVCRRVSLPIVLTGGVFQNRLLTELVIDELRSSGLPVGTHSSIPPNDGGLATGQIAVGLARAAMRNDNSNPSTDGVR